MSVHLVENCVKMTDFLRFGCVDFSCSTELIRPEDPLAERNER